jgi:hypothetical protein
MAIPSSYSNTSDEARSSYHNNHTTTATTPMDYAVRDPATEPSVGRVKKSGRPVEAPSSQQQQPKRRGLRGLFGGKDKKLLASSKQKSSPFLTGSRTAATQPSAAPARATSAFTFGGRAAKPKKAAPPRPPARAVTSYMAPTPPPAMARARSSFLFGARRQKKLATEPPRALQKAAPKQEKRHVKFTQGPHAAAARSTSARLLGPAPVARVPAAYPAAAPAAGSGSFYHTAGKHPSPPTAHAQQQSASYAGTSTKDFRQAQNAYSYHETDGQTYVNVANEYIDDELEASYFNA